MLEDLEEMIWRLLDDKFETYSALEICHES
jgi:hypothetical protein